MNILLTNDDGYNSEGILLLAKLLKKYGNVVIVAPDSPRSGNSAALSIGKPLHLEKVENNIYKLDGTPVDCVSVGLRAFNIEFDLVVSGCNHGWNISYDTIYSGTVGAALQALIGGVPSFAVSVNKDFFLVEKYFDLVYDFITKNKLVSKEYMLNINFPDDEVKDIRLGKLYYRNDKFSLISAHGGLISWRELDANQGDEDSDCYQVNHGVVSIVPLSKSYFHNSLYLELINKIQK